MRANKHTPGPWRAECEEDAWRVYAPIAKGSGQWVIARAFRYTQPDESGEANAKLIAAAPALADAIEHTLSCEDCAANSTTICMRHGQELCAALRAAGRLP